MILTDDLNIDEEFVEFVLIEEGLCYWVENSANDIKVSYVTWLSGNKFIDYIIPVPEVEDYPSTQLSTPPPLSRNYELNKSNLILFFRNVR